MNHVKWLLISYGLHDLLYAFSHQLEQHNVSFSYVSEATTPSGRPGCSASQVLAQPDCTSVDHYFTIEINNAVSSQYLLKLCLRWVMIFSSKNITCCSCLPSMSVKLKLITHFAPNSTALNGRMVDDKSSVATQVNRRKIQIVTLLSTHPRIKLCWQLCFKLPSGNIKNNYYCLHLLFNAGKVRWVLFEQ